MKQSGLSIYFIEWKAGQYRQDYSKDTFVFRDGTELTREVLMDYPFTLERARAKAYWYALPWYKKLFRKEPISHGDLQVC